jgi:hypothetical protein
MSAEDETSEGHLLEMSNHFKELYEKLTEDNEKLKKEIITLKKALISAYGMIRILDECLTFTLDVPQDIVCLIEVLRGYLSDFMDTHVFNLS